MMLAASAFSDLYNHYSALPAGAGLALFGVLPAPLFIPFRDNLQIPLLCFQLFLLASGEVGTVRFLFRRGWGPIAGGLSLLPTYFFLCFSSNLFLVFVLPYYLRMF